jgi:hypothetical protein
MVLRLFLFVLFYAGILIVPGAGLAYIGYLALKPKLARRRLRKEAQARALLDDGGEPEVCYVCLEAVDVHADALDEHGWNHVSCVRKLLNP